MDKIRRLVDDLRTRAAGFKGVAENCSNEDDRLALQARADEAKRCADEIELACNEAEGKIR